MIRKQVFPLIFRACVPNLPVYISRKDDCVVKFRIFSLFETDFSSDGVPTGSGGSPETPGDHPRKTGKMVKRKTSIKPTGVYDQVQKCYPFK